MKKKLCYVGRRGLVAAVVVVAEEVLLVLRAVELQEEGEEDGRDEDDGDVEQCGVDAQAGAGALAGQGGGSRDQGGGGRGDARGVLPQRHAYGGARGDGARRAQHGQGGGGDEGGGDHCGLERCGLERCGSERRGWGCGRGEGGGGKGAAEREGKGGGGDFVLYEVAVGRGGKDLFWCTCKSDLPCTSLVGVVSRATRVRESGVTCGRCHTGNTWNR